MNYKIVETHGIGPHRRETVYAGADSLADAIATARAMFKIVDLEIDALNPHCADFFTACGRVMQIEPYYAR
jgi:hypothetical protein